MRTRFAVVLAFLCLTASALHAETIDLGSLGVFRIDLPEGWKIERKPDEPDIKLALIPPSENPTGKYFFSLFAGGKSFPSDEAHIKISFMGLARAEAENSVEQKVIPINLGMIQGYGVYSIFTNPKLVGQPIKPDLWKAEVFGMIGFTDHVMASINFWTNDSQSPEFTALMQAIRTSTVTNKNLDSVSP